VVRLTKLGGMEWAGNICRIAWLKKREKILFRKIYISQPVGKPNDRWSCQKKKKLLRPT